MSQVSHTPAPWFQSHRQKQGGAYSTEVYDVNGTTIATVDWYPVKLAGGVTRTAREANAKLIAASPVMYEALKVARDILLGDGEPDVSKAANILMDAIDKVEGGAS